MISLVLPAFMPPGQHERTSAVKNTLYHIHSISFIDLLGALKLQTPAYLKKGQFRHGRDMDLWSSFH